jgi:hypothetical protein
MSKEETSATWRSWLLDAIHKIRFQKQRPNVERVAACVRMHHPQYSNEAVEEHLEACAEDGNIQKVGKGFGLLSKGVPGSNPSLGQSYL